MADFTFVLNDSIPFTGTSDDDPGSDVPIYNDTDHKWMYHYKDLASVKASYVHTEGPVLVEFSGFKVITPTGPSRMGLDLLLKIGDGTQGAFQRFVELEASAMRFSLVSYDFQDGKQYDNIGFQVRSVLVNGPPSTIQVSGTATLRLRTKVRALAFSIQQPQIKDAEEPFPVTVMASWPDVNANINVTLNLPDQVKLGTNSDSPTIRHPATSAKFELIGTQSQISQIKPTAVLTGPTPLKFEPPVPLKIKIRPVIQDIQPRSGSANAEFTITCKGFPTGARVILDYMPCEYAVDSQNKTLIHVRVPAALSSGRYPVFIQLEVKDAQGFVVDSVWSQGSYPRSSPKEPSEQIVFTVVG